MSVHECQCQSTHQPAAPLPGDSWRARRRSTRSVPCLSCRAPRATESTETREREGRGAGRARVFLAKMGRDRRTEYNGKNKSINYTAPNRSDRCAQDGHARPGVCTHARMRSPPGADATACIAISSCCIRGATCGVERRRLAACSTPCRSRCAHVPRWQHRQRRATASGWRVKRRAGLAAAADCACAGRDTVEEVVGQSQRRAR